jgi:hypothetical protein
MTPQRVFLGGESIVRIAECKKYSSKKNKFIKTFFGTPYIAPVICDYESVKIVAKLIENKFFKARIGIQHDCYA